jgi:hypothetical protein
MFSFEIVILLYVNADATVQLSMYLDSIFDGTGHGQTSVVRDLGGPLPLKVSDPILVLL